MITISIATGLFYGLINSLIITPGLAALGWVISDTAVWKFIFHFRFTARFPKTIAHDKRLSNFEEQLDYFFETISELKEELLLKVKQ